MTQGQLFQEPHQHQLAWLVVVHGDLQLPTRLLRPWVMEQRYQVAGWDHAAGLWPLGHPCRCELPLT